MSERRIHPLTLLTARLLTATAYSGLVLILPPVLAAHYWRKVAEVSADIVDAALSIWADTIATEYEELA